MSNAVLALTPEQRARVVSKVSVQDAKDTLWRRGVLEWKLRPEQRIMRELLWSMPKGLAVFNISRRLGKSTTCVCYCLEHAIRRKCHIRYATAFLTDLESFLIPIFELMLVDCPPDIKPQWKPSKKRFEFPNGSVIRLIGLDKNPNGLRGNNIDILIGDESAFIKNLKYLYESIIIPATMNREFQLIFPSTPPVSPEHFWAKSLIAKARARNTYIEMTIDQISGLAREERQRLLDEVGGEGSATAKREFFCKVIVDETRAVCASFDSAIHVDTYPDIDEAHVKWMICGDTGGVRDKTVFLRVGYDHDSGLILIREELVFEPKTPTSTIIEAFYDRFMPSVEERELGDPGPVVVLDASGQLLIDYAEAGLDAALPQKDEFNASILLLTSKFHRNEVRVHPDCELLIRTLAGGLLNEVRTDFERTPDLGHCDAAAACIYALRSVDKMTDIRPKPDPSRVFIVPRPSHMEEQFSKLGWG